MRALRTLCLAGLAGLATPAFPAEVVPVEDFVRHPTYSTAKISPDGRYLAISVDRGDQDVLTILRTSDLQILKINQLPNQRSVGAFHWVSPERLIFTAVRKVGRYEQPFGTGEWYAVNADGSQPRTLIDYGTRDATQRSKSVANETFRLLDTLRGDDRNVIMTASRPRSADGAGTEVVMLDTLTGRRSSMGRAPKANCSISLDSEKRARFAVCASDRNEAGEFEERTELYRREDSGTWTLLNASASDGKHLIVIGSTTGGTVYALEDDDRSPAGFGTLDVTTGEFRSLFRDPVAEVSDYVFASDGETIIGVVTEAGAPAVTLLDEEHPDAQLYLALAQSFPDNFVNFSSATADGSKIIVATRSGSNPGELYLYDRDSGQARLLLQQRQWIDPAKMASVQPFHMTGRDGTPLYGYLTIPHGAELRNLPMIVNPHGGPIGPRDRWGFNFETQLLANRGYLVLQVNFRGSGGFGQAFRNAGHGQWGDGIQNDINDAARWAIEQGYADPQRICIYGGSFGGYSSLMAPIREPGLYKCAVGYVGVYDLPMMFERGDVPQRASGLRYLRRTLGTSREELLRNSPTARAAEVGIPVFLAAGARDARAVPEQTEAMRDALRRAGNPPVETIIQSGEMHGFYKEENSANLYSRMLRFFEDHIGN